MRPVPLVLYHGGCFDGFTAAWVFNKFYQEKRNQFDPDPEFVPMNYGDKAPDCSGREVYVLDFSFPRDVMIEKIILPSNRTTVWDHHKTAEEDLKGLKDEIRAKYNVNRQYDKIVFDMHRSGAGITFDEMIKDAGRRAGAHTPQTMGRTLWLVDYIEDRDLWTWKLPHSREVSAYISTQPMTFESWDAISKLTLAEIVEKGKAVQAYVDQFGDKAIKFARKEKIAGHKVYTINVPYMNCSDHVNRLLEQKGGDFAAGYFRQLDGKWQFSLRSIGEFDVSAIAQVYGGGGHKNAAGFKVDVLPWEQAEVVAELATDTLKGDE